MQIPITRFQDRPKSLGIGDVVIAKIYICVLDVVSALSRSNVQFVNVNVNVTCASRAFL